MAKVLILGGSGMLGSSMVNVFQGFDGEVISSFRPNALRPDLGKSIAVTFDAQDEVSELLKSLKFGPNDFVLNCIGMVKAHIDDNSESSRAQAILLNALLPQKISTAINLTGSRALQIATDCVFSGQTGNYDEHSLHDATDVYGKTKSLGEIPNDRFMHIRSSIIGRELSGHTSLLGWLQNLPLGAAVSAYSNHRWNGVGAHHFAKVCRAVVEKDLFKAGVSHLIPADVVTKGSLVRLIANQIGREDVTFEDVSAPETIDRTLSTLDKKFSRTLWQSAGYAEVPTIANLVAEI